MVRRLLLAVLLCALAGAFGAARAQAAPLRPVLANSLTTQHFVIHYTKTERQAGDLAALAERAYALETGWGFAAPPDDGDGHIDLYVVDLSGTPGVLGAALQDNPGVPGTSGSIDIDEAAAVADDAFVTVAHELFHLIQFRYWTPGASDSWLLEAEAEWLGFKAGGYSTIAGTTGPPDLSLDCAGTKCSTSQYETGGYSRWNFLEYLAQRFGTTFAIDVATQAQSAGSAFGGLTAAIAAKGTTLTTVYNDFTSRWMAGGWGIDALDSEVPDHYATIQTGLDTGDLPVLTVPVNHMATRYVVLNRGDGAGDHPCFAATLTLTVTLPGNVGTSRPAFFWDVKGSSPVALSVNGSTATATVPWDTCAWPAHSGHLSLPNPTTNVDAADFKVAVHLTVDPNTPAAPTAPPDPQTVYGGVTPVDSAQVPPTITLLAPQMLKVSVAKPTIKLVAQSNGDGALHATIGSVDLGTQAVRAGNNALVFTVPASLLSTLRRFAAAGNLLTLTPVSPSGTVTGNAVTRTIVFQAAPKPAAKPKPKKKK
jgi:hypothetical protein